MSNTFDAQDALSKTDLNILQDKLKAAQNEARRIPVQEHSDRLLYMLGEWLGRSSLLLDNLGYYMDEAIHPVDIRSTTNDFDIDAMIVEQIKLQDDYGSGATKLLLGYLRLAHDREVFAAQRPPADCTGIANEAEVEFTHDMLEQYRGKVAQLEEQAVIDAREATHFEGLFTKRIKELEVLLDFVWKHPAMLVSYPTMWQRVRNNKATDDDRKELGLE